MKRRAKKKLLGGLVVCVGGTATVFGLMLLMNGFDQKPEKPDLEKKTNFEVAPEPDPPEKEPEPEPKKQAREAPKEPVEPPPELGSGVGTLDLNLPGLEADGAIESGSEKMLGDVQASVMTADAVDQKPEPMRRVDPDLPRRLVEQQVEGEVIVKALVDREGRVVEVRVVRAKPEGAFEEPVKEAVRRWQFQPASYEGESVKTWVEVPFRFELS